VNVTSFTPTAQVDDYFLVVSRLNAYKRIDLVVEAFNELRLPLVIAGEGPCREQLQRMAGSTITFLGRVDEKKLLSLYEQCRAFIFPGDEDFGIVPVEAQAAGRPVIAFAAGGALETVIEGVTGVFFHESSARSLVDAVKTFISKKDSFIPDRIRNNALRFDKEVFKTTIQQFVHAKMCAGGKLR
jgi:glycosyltransferase involved in cell wall biosynthesis